MENIEQNLDDNVGPDGFVIAPDTPRAQAHRMLSQLERESLAVKRQLKTIKFATGKAALQVDSRRAVDLMVAIQERRGWLLQTWSANSTMTPGIDNPAAPLSNREYHQLISLLLDLSRVLVNPKWIFHTEEITLLLQTAVQQQEQAANTPAFKYWRSSTIPFVKLAADHIATHGIMLAWRPLLERLRDVPRGAGHEDALYIAQIFGYDGLDVMLPGSIWVTSALQDLAGMETAQKERWHLLLKHAARRDRGHKPSARWLLQAKTHIEAVGRDEFQEHLNRWLALVGKPLGKWQPDEAERCYLHGLLGMVAMLDNSHSSSQVGWVAESNKEYAQCLHACFDTLAAMPGLEPLFELTRLQTKITNIASLKMLSKALISAAQRAGLSRCDLDDLRVPTFKLEMPRQMRHAFGEYAVMITFEGAIKGIWQWFGSNGKARKTLPSEVKQNHAAELDVLKARVRDIEEMRAFQCAY